MTFYRVAGDQTLAVTMDNICNIFARTFEGWLSSLKKNPVFCFLLLAHKKFWQPNRPGLQPCVSIRLLIFQTLGVQPTQVAACAGAHLPRLVAGADPDWPVAPPAARRARALAPQACWPSKPARPPSSPRALPPS